LPRMNILIKIDSSPHIVGQVDFSDRSNSHDGILS
jgi:hypothetical protein